MMWLYYEYLLMAVLVGLYIYDSAILIHINEAILVPTTGASWGIRFASDRFSLKGKDIYIPFLLGHHASMYRVSWSSLPNKTSVIWSPPFRSIPWLREFQWSTAFALFVLLPVGLFSRLGNLAVAFAVVVAYSSMLGALISIWIQRDLLGITYKKFAAFAFEILSCPPFALNLTRHLSLMQQVNEDLIPLSKRLLSPESWEATKNILLERIDHAADWEEEDSSEREALLALRNRLQAQPNA